MQHMRDSMTLNSYSKRKGYMCNTAKVKKKEWVFLSSLLAKSSH